MFLILVVNTLHLNFGIIFRVMCDCLEIPAIWGKALSVLSATASINSRTRKESCRMAEKEPVQAGTDRWGAEGGEGTVNLKRKL